MMDGRRMMPDIIGHVPRGPESPSRVKNDEANTLLIVGFDRSHS